MLHELLRRLAEDAPSTTTPVGAVVAVAGAIAALLGAVTGLLATLLGRRRNAAENGGSHPHPMPLNSDTASDGHDDPKDARIAVLEAFCMRRHYDPNLIVTGREDPTDVQFT